VGEGGGGRRVGQVIRRHVHGLDRGDRAHLGGGDALLQAAHFLGQRRLVAHGGRHAAQQGGHFGTGQRVAVDVVDEEEHVAAFVAERLGDGQAGQRHAQAVARGLVHLAVDHGHLRLAEVLEVDHARVGHLVIEVVAFAGALTHAGEHRQTGVGLGDVVDELHHVHGLAHAGAAEQAHLAALGEGADQVDHLDAGFQQVGRRREFVVGRCLAVDRSGDFLADRAALVDRATEHVHDAAQGRLAHGHGDRVAGVGHDEAAAQAVGRAERNGAHHAVAELLLHFEGQRAAFVLQGVVHLGHLVAREFHVDHGADTLNDLALRCICLSHHLLR
jgi:hypothetical protein